MLSNPLIERLIKFSAVLVAVVIAFVAVLTLNALKENKYIGGNSGSNVITVSGEGEAFAVPDIAEFSFDVTAEATTLVPAQEEVTEKMNAIIAYLKDEGIDERDIKTTNYSSNPRYEWQGGEVYSTGAGTSVGGSDAMMMYPVPYPGNGTQVIVGYEVHHSVSVKIRDTEKAGTIVTGVGALGVTNMYGPNFTVDDEDALMRDARKDAIRDAKDKAEELADDLDVKLVRIISFSENGGGYYPMYARMEGGMAYDSAEVKVAPEIPEGENKINASVSITYEIR